MFGARCATMRQALPTDPDENDSSREWNPQAMMMRRRLRMRSETS
jgi:hypothetical protein